MRAPSAPTFALASPLALAHMRRRRERRIGEARHAGRIGRDQRGLALVPGRQHLRIGQAADQAGMDQAGEVHAGHMARRGVEALDVPDRLLRQREMLGQEAAAVLLGEEAVEAPQAFLLRPDVEQVDHQEIAGLRALHADRAGQEVHDRQVDVAHVVGRIVVLDEAAGPVVGLDDEVVARIDPRHDRNVRMPAIVDHVVVVGRLREIDLDQCLWHQKLPCLQAKLQFRQTRISRSARRRRRRARRRARSRRSRSPARGRRYRARSSAPARRPRSTGRARRGCASACAPCP